MESLVSDIPAEDEKINNLFYSLLYKCTCNMQRPFIFLTEEPSGRPFSGEGNLCLRCSERKMYTIMRALLLCIYPLGTWDMATSSLFSANVTKKHYLHLLLLTSPVSFLSGFIYKSMRMYSCYTKPSRGRILGRNPDKNLKSFPPCNSQ